MDEAPIVEDWGDALLAWIAVQGVNIAIALVLLVVGWFAAKLVKRWVEHYMERSDHMDPIVEHFLSSLLYYALLVVILIIALNLMGVQTASLIAILGAASLAIGLALQGSLTSLAAGVMIILIRPFRIGDYIEVSGHAGTVKSISLFLTELSTYDNIQKMLPNSEVWSSTVTNYSVYPTRMLDLVVGIDYGDPIEAGLDTLRSIASSHEKVLDDPAPNAFVSEIGDSSVDLTLRLWVPAADYWPVRRELTKRIKEEIEGAGLSIPYPHRQLVEPKPTKPNAAPAKE